MIKAMNDTDQKPSWKPIDQELLKENIETGKVKSITIKEISNNEYIVEVGLSWRTEPSRIMQNKDKSKTRTFKNLDRLKTYLQETGLNHLKITLELKSDNLTT